MGEVKIIRPKDEADWHSVRSNHITGSDAPVIIGVGYEDQYTRWAKKTGKLPDTGDKLRFRVGHALEPIIHKELESRRDLLLWDPGDMTVFVAENGWQAATLDRVIMEPGGTTAALLDDDLGGARGIAQFKTVGQYMVGEWKDGPNEYTYVQVLHEMAVLGVEWGVAAALLGMGDWADFDIYHDQDMLDALMEAEHNFYRHCVEDMPPPVGGESSKGAIKSMYNQVAPGKLIVLPPEGGWLVKGDAWLDLKQKQKDAKAALKVADDALAIVENELKMAVGEGERLEIQGIDGAWTWKKTKRPGYVVNDVEYRTWRKVKK